MNTTQQNSLQSSSTKEPEVPNLFIFILGMILVFGSGVKNNGQEFNFNDSVSTEVTILDNQENFTSEFINTTDARLEDVLAEIPVKMKN
ncbi:MAG: hypothetical protein AB8F94_16145 [Saprospiraceae bacterium]